MKSHHSFDVTFYIRQNKNKLRDYSIYCCIKVKNTLPKEICITGGIKKANWDIGKSRLKQSSDELIKLSLYLYKIKAKLLNIYLDLKLTESDISAKIIKNMYQRKE